MHFPICRVEAKQFRCHLMSNWSPVIKFLSKASLNFIGTHSDLNTVANTVANATNIVRGWSIELIGFLKHQLQLLLCVYSVYNVSARAKNGDHYSYQNGSTGDQKFASSHQIVDLFKINDIIVKDVGHQIATETCELATKCLVRTVVAKSS